MRLASIATYPVKSFYRVEQDRAVVEPWGLQGDRRFMLVDAEGDMITQREDARLALCRPAYRDGELTLRWPGRPDLTVPARAGEPVKVTVWRTTFEASRMPAEADAWLSGALDRPVRLAFLSDPMTRPVDPDYAGPDDRVNMADGFPLLLTSMSSLHVLNDWIRERGGDPLPMNRFRPNVVVEDAPAWAEDGWLNRRLRIGRVVFRLPKACARCVITTTDQETGERGREPLRTLARQRNVNQRLLFGTNMIPENTGEIRVGDEMEILPE
jgi:uncharacterized protein YcbX